MDCQNEVLDLVSIPCSDINIVEHISNINYQEIINAFAQLKPVKFKHNGKNYLGFYAQDVSDAGLTDLVETTAGISNLDYIGLIAPMIAVIQKLVKDNDKMKEDLLSCRMKNY